MAEDGFAIPHTVLRHFDLSSSPYTAAAVDAVARRRASFPHQRLFFDQLAAFVGIDGPALYPPSTPAALRRLLHAVHASTADRLKRDCFFYYLLRDHAEGAGVDDSGGGMSVDAPAPGARARAFAKTRCMPAAWVALMDGYWALDHALWEAAVDALSDPRIPDVNFISDILAVLRTHVAPPSRAAALAHALLTTTPRAPGSAADADVALIATASAAGVPAAFALARALPDAAARARAQTDIWAWALGAPRVPVGRGAPQPQRRALRELLHLPLTDDEHAHLLALLMRPPGGSVGAAVIPPPALSLLHDLVALRLVHQGRYAEALALDRALAGRGADADRQRRRDAVREFIDILPEAQRRALRVDAALRPDTAAAADAPLANGHGAGGDVDMASSWIEVDAAEAAPPAPAPAHTPAPAPVAPTPIRAALRHDARPSSPARAASPFAGPPRFATASAAPPTPGSAHTPAPPSPAPPPAAAPAASLPARVPSPAKHSASPFAPPRPAPASAAKPRPRPKRMIIDDGDGGGDGGRARAPPPQLALRRSVRQSVEPDAAHGRALESTDGADDGDAEMADEPAPARTPARRTRRAVSAAREAATPAALAPSTPARRTRRQTTAPPDADGAAEPAPAPADDMPPPPIPGSFITAPPPAPAPAPAPPTPARTPRARMTRSASRAHLDDEPAPAAPALSKRPKSAAKRSATRELDAADDAASRRSSRRATSVATSDAGSPTPSVASTAARSDAGAGRRRRETAASATPRATRARK